MEVEIPLGETRERILVPLPSVLRDADTRPFAFVVEQREENPRVKRRPLALGPLDGDRVTVSAGLHLGDFLVVRGQHFLRDGDPVRILD